MARLPWITNWHWKYRDKEWDTVDMPEFFGITIYKSTTGQYTEEEMEEFENSPDMCSEVVHIPVPRKLLFDWWIEQGEHKREFGVGYIPETEDGLITWLREEYTWDETYDLYDWLKAHNYYWKRLD